jgi:L-lactate dehydrogenase (cytochrome)
MRCLFLSSQSSRQFPHYLLVSRLSLKVRIWVRHSHQDCLTISELQQYAKKSIPKMFYDYVDSGSWSESTYQINESDFQKIKFRQRVAKDITNRNLKTKMINENVTIPVGLGPAGFTGMQRANGEILAAQAATEFGVPFTLSTMSICSIEEVAKNVSSPFWFQLYVMKDRKFSKKLIQRAKAAGCSALMLTLDLQVLGQRHKDIKNGLSAPPKFTIPNILNMATKPTWCLGMLRTRNHNFGNIVGHVDGITDLTSLSSWISEQFDPSLNWDDVLQIREWWGDGKFILKGIMDPEDAREAVRRVDCNAIVISNHGGRQLDHTVSTISILPEIIQSIQAELVKQNRSAGEIEIWLDSGIRSGQDVLKAMALGANGTLIGRSYLYGLGAGGKDGVTHALNILKKEMDLTLGLCGRNDINFIDDTILQINPFSISKKKIE